jgi:hypothetical protein
MTDTASGILILLLIIICVACAAWRLAGIFLHTLPKGPSYVLAFLGLWAALFLAIPPTLIWGLVLAAILGICQMVALWKTHARHHIGAGT